MGSIGYNFLYFVLYCFYAIFFPDEWVPKSRYGEEDFGIAQKHQRKNNCCSKKRFWPSNGINKSLQKLTLQPVYFLAMTLAKNCSCGEENLFWQRGMIKIFICFSLSIFTPCKRKKICYQWEESFNCKGGKQEVLLPKFFYAIFILLYKMPNFLEASFFHRPKEKLFFPSFSINFVLLLKFSWRRNRKKCVFVEPFQRVSGNVSQITFIFFFWGGCLISSVKFLESIFAKFLIS